MVKNVKQIVAEKKWLPIFNNMYTVRYGSNVVLFKLTIFDGECVGYLLMTVSVLWALDTICLRSYAVEEFIALSIVLIAKDYRNKNKH